MNRPAMPRKDAMTTATARERTPQPWYREPWPWFLMVGPFIVIVAGIVTAWIAVKTSDGLVTEDYYKQGLMVGETLVRSRHAEELGLRAGLRLREGAIRVRLESERPFTMPAALDVTLSHPTRAGLDQQSRLLRDGDGYAGTINLPASGHWLVLIEDEGKTWRLMSALVLPAANELMVGGCETADCR